MTRDKNQQTSRSWGTPGEMLSARNGKPSCGCWLTSSASGQLCQRRHAGDTVFKDISLTGADVYWLAAYALTGKSGDLVAAQNRLREAIYNGYIVNLPTLHWETLYVNTSRGSPASQPRRCDAAPSVAITRMLPTASETSPGDPRRPSLPRSTPA